MFFGYAFLVMSSYYALKTIREPLLLSGAGAEIKSYAAAAIAAILLAVVPLYGAVFRGVSRLNLTRYMTLFFVLVLMVFYFLGRAGHDIGFTYYVFVGMFSVLITAQFWAFAADSFNVKSGQRLFPLIMVGATLGSLVAPAAAGMLFAKWGPWPVLMLAITGLALTVPFVASCERAVPPGSGSHHPHPDEPEHGGFWSGLSLVLGDRYLMLLAVLVVLLNWVNTTGEYILAELVIEQAEAAARDSDVTRADYIAAFYGNFFSVVNLLTLIFQVFLVARVIHWIGIRGAILVAPVIALVGYGLVVFLPVFSLIRLVKVLENSTDYSLMNTTRHALYLPLGPAKKYEGKTTIDAFFWRLGDLAQAGVIFAGLTWFGFGITEFAMVNMVLALVWLGVSYAVARRFQEQEEESHANLPPRLVHDLEDRTLDCGTHFDFQLPRDTFMDPDEGDVLQFSARLANASGLPGWMRFDAEALHFSGVAPASGQPAVDIVVRATDFDGAWAEGRFHLSITAKKD